MAIPNGATSGARVLLDALDDLPAVVFNGRLDLLAANALGRTLYAPVYDLPGRPNSVRFLFLDEPGPATSSPSGSGSRVTPWPCSGPRSAAIPTTPS